MRVQQKAFITQCYMYLSRVVCSFILLFHHMTSREQRDILRVHTTASKLSGTKQPHPSAIIHQTTSPQCHHTPNYLTQVPSYTKLPHPSAIIHQTTSPQCHHTPNYLTQVPSYTKLPHPSAIMHQTTSPKCHQTPKDYIKGTKDIRRARQNCFHLCTAAIRQRTSYLFPKKTCGNTQTHEH